MTIERGFRSLSSNGLADYQSAPESLDSNPAMISPDQVSRPLTSAVDYLALPRSQQAWHIDSLLPLSGSLLLYGDAKVGKSFAGLQLANALTTGSNWLSFPVPEPRRVCYIQLDTPRSLWASRVQQLASSGLHIDGLFLEDRETLGVYPFDILDPSHKLLLVNTLAATSPSVDVVIIDTLREAHSGDENDSTEMQKVIAHLTDAVKPAALVIVSHSRKSNPEIGRDLMNDNRGSNYVVGRMDAIVRFSARSMRVSGRALEERTIKLNRLPGGLWELAQEEGIDVKDMARSLLADRSYSSDRDRAIELSKRSGRSFEASRKVLSRA